MNRTYAAARVHLRAETIPFINKSLKDRLPARSESFVVYQFTCTCGARYLGHTTRRLSKRIAEHCPASLRHGTIKNVHSSILEHLINTGHHVLTDDAFKVLYAVPKRNPKGLRKRLLATSEAMAIALLQPELCKQRTLVQALTLPWPERLAPSAPTLSQG